MKARPKSTLVGRIASSSADQSALLSSMWSRARRYRNAIEISERSAESARPSASCTPNAA
jgi:hypothetical protein